MPLYALMAATGSTLGCVLLYFIARKGGEALFHSRTGKHGGAIRHWVERNGFGGMLAAALLPPPTPFKFFVFAAGVFKMPLASFISAIAVARLFRYFGVGYLAVRFGDGALAVSRAPQIEGRYCRDRPGGAGLRPFTINLAQPSILTEIRPRSPSTNLRQ